MQEFAHSSLQLPATHRCLSFKTDETIEAEARAQSYDVRLAKQALGGWEHELVHNLLVEYLERKELADELDVAEHAHSHLPSARIRSCYRSTPENRQAPTRHTPIC